MKTSTSYSREMWERAVQLVLDHKDEHRSQYAAIVSVAAKSAQDAGARKPRASVRERDPSQGIGVFRPGRGRSPTQVMKTFIDAHRCEYGVEPICRSCRLLRRRSTSARPARRTRRECRHAPVTSGIGPSGDSTQPPDTRALMAGPLSENTTFRGVNPHILCSPLMRAFR